MHIWYTADAAAAPSTKSLRLKVTLLAGVILLASEASLPSRTNGTIFHIKFSGARAPRISGVCG